jgi:hypothetical protein
VCCQPKERAAHVRGLSLRRDDVLLSAAIAAYARRRPFMLDLQSAFARFWNGDFSLEAAETLEWDQLEPFLDWYEHDYRTTKDRQRIVDLFAAEEGPRLTPEQRALLAERQAAYLSLYGVEVVDADGRLEIGDLLAGGFYRVEDAGLARLATPGGLLLGRRLGKDNDSRLLRSTVLLPGTLGPAMVAAAKRAFGAYREEHYQATWPEFLREVGYILFHFLVSEEAAEGYRRAPEREGYYDPRVAVEGMRAAMRRQAEEAAQKEAEEEEARRREEESEAAAMPEVERTAGGILIPRQPAPSASSERRILLPGDLRH